MAELLPLLPSPADPLTWLLVAAVAVARGLDFLSTWVVTPRLELEANPVARHLGWGRMAAGNALLLGLPLLHHGLSITLVVLSLLVAGTNLSGAALARGMGERAQREAQSRALRRLGLGTALLLNSTGSLLVCAAGAVILWLVPRADSPAGWAALGVVLFGASGLVHLNAAVLRLYRQGRATAETKGARHGR